MSKGKYSPTVYGRRYAEAHDFRFNARGEVPPATWDVYDEETHFANYDKDGFDSYGYSAYDSDGKYAGIGHGIDRAGYTEDQYLCMSDEQYEDCF